MQRTSSENSNARCDYAREIIMSHVWLGWIIIKHVVVVNPQCLNNAKPTVTIAMSQLQLTCSTGRRLFKSGIF
jgi:hypothetical protein